ncbi:MAG: phosphoribosylamine--glycine ligase [Anaerolineaceae bacterium]|nr:phosphoribosylamine--glycine ligase [Anaerolineaceae bacterium]
MRIGLIGSGGREHAMAKALRRQLERDTLFVYASHHNPGIDHLADETLVGSLADASAIVEFFSAHQVDFVAVGPEVPLMAGAVDALRAAGVPTVGANQAQAQIESDKHFMRRLLAKVVPWGSPDWQLVHSRKEAEEFIKKVGEVAVKPTGLTGGKGVQVMGTQLLTVGDALDYIDEWLAQDSAVLLEERLVGEEFSRMVFASDEVLAPVSVAQDFKYAYEEDRGLMTGGMGAYTMADGSMPFLTEENLEQADKLMAQVIHALGEESGAPYRGVLYGQFMVTARGIRVIEFNARLGDPEAINVMTLLEGDPAQVFFDIARGQLDTANVHFAKSASLTKYIVPAEYPEQSIKGRKFAFDTAKVEAAGFQVIFASVQAASGDLWETLGSRTLAVVGLGEHPGRLCESMEALLAELQPDTLRHRADIGSRELIEQKTARMAALRRGEQG